MYYSHNKEPPKNVGDYSASIACWAGLKNQDPFSGPHQGHVSLVIRTVNDGDADLKNYTCRIDADTAHLQKERQI